MLEAFANEPCIEMIHNLRRRRLYKRIAVLSGWRWPDRYDGAYNRFWTYRDDEAFTQIEKRREEWEAVIIEKVEQKLSGSGQAEVDTRVDPEEIIDGLKRTEPLILVDVPIKGTAGGESETIWYLPEDERRGHVRRHVVREFEEEPALLRGRPFDQVVGKIRVFAHPRWSDSIRDYLSDDEILDIVCP